MGSFNVACGLTGIAIREGDRAGLVIIDDNLFTETARTIGAVNPAGSFTMLAEHSTPLPAFPPIYGTYDSYGNLENIEESATTSLLERLYGRSISTLLGVMSCTRGAYDNYGKMWETYAVDKSALNVAESEILTTVGFVQDDETPALYIFEGHTLTHNGIEWEVLNSHGKNVTSARVRNTSVKEGLALFAHSTGLYPGYSKQDYATLKALFTYQGMFFLTDIFTGLVAQNQDLVQPLEKTWDDLMNKLNSFIGKLNNGVAHLTYMSSSARTFMMNHTSFPENKAAYLKNFTEDYSFLSIVQLNNFMSEAGRIYSPSVVLSEVDYGFTRTFRELMNTFLTARAIQDEED